MRDRASRDLRDEGRDVIVGEQIGARDDVVGVVGGFVGEGAVSDGGDVVGGDEGNFAILSCGVDLVGGFDDRDVFFGEVF